MVWQGPGDDVIAVHGPDGRFEKVSSGSLTLFGLQPEVLVGRRLMEVVAPEFQPALLRAMAQIAKANGPGRAVFEFRVRRERGPGIALEMSLSRTAGGFRSVTRNIEHRLAEEEAIRQESREVMDLASLRSEQLANVSHELRTPLNAVVGFAGAIHGEQFGPIKNERYRDYARIIHESGDHLLSLISDILDLNKAEANETAIQLGAEDLSRLINLCTDILHLRVSEAGLTLHTDIEHDLGLVMLDAKIFRQILLNLLSNALKFTAAGSITVRARRIGKMMEVSVIDTGVGMSPDDLARVGTRFHQARKEGVRGTRGNGIGLSLSKALARVLGGELVLSSDAGRGTTALLRLPYRPVEQDEEPEHLEDEKVVALAAMRG